jgi:hypothetical protein
VASIITEITFNELRDIYEPDGLFLICGDVPSNFVWFENFQRCNILIPKFEREYRIGVITRKEFEEKYKLQLRSPAIKEYIHYLKSLDYPIYLVTRVDTGFLAKNI